MANTLRVRRRSSAGAAGAPTSLAAAELAFNEKDNVLYYGWGNSGGAATNIIPIAGPGAFAQVLVSDTPPGGAPDGSFWFESDTGNLYFRYNDGTSAQWIAAAPRAFG
jgi:hypothetical protein